MRIAIITDSHFGARADSQVISDYFSRFYDEIFFPYLDANPDIDHVFHLGDVVDRRKYLNTNTAEVLTNKLIEPLHKRKVSLTITIGNHDCFYKTTNRLNAMRQFYSKWDHISIIDDAPREGRYGATTILFVPWICDENREESLQRIKDSKAHVCMGHLELAGFEMHRGQVKHEGMSKHVFDKFDMTLSGHYHHRSSDGSVFYLGTPYEIYWSDYDDPRGFHVFDTETRGLTFIRNPNVLFKKIVYDDAFLTFQELANLDFEDVKGCYVKVIVRNKDNPALFDAFMTKVELSGPVDLQTVDDHLNLDMESDEEIVAEAEDTRTTLTKSVKSLNVPNEPALSSYVEGLYNTALSME